MPRGALFHGIVKSWGLNPHCTTIILPLLTRAVERQLKTERDIDRFFNLLDICRDQGARSKFLIELFKFILREDVPEQS